MISRSNLLVIAALCLFLLLPGTNVIHAQTEEVAWLADYWNNVALEGDPDVSRAEADLDHRWGSGSPTDIASDRFSARWTTRATFAEGTYRFTTRSDDGVRVWVDNRRIIDNWTLHPATVNTATIPLAGGEHTVRVEYFENTGLALITLDWERVGDDEEESVSITPTSGPPGTAALIGASGFTPNTAVIVGVGRAGAEPTVEYEVVTNADGAVQRQVVIPLAEAQPGETWRVLVRAPATNESALSPPFTVTEGAEVGCGPTYTVRPGDWLARIARRCNTTVDALLAANAIVRDPNRIYPGQVLTIPQGDVAAQVSITPESGDVATPIQVNAIGFAPNERVLVAMIPAGTSGVGLNPQVVFADDAGQVEVTLTLPDVATAGERWVATVRSETQRARSETFIVVGTAVTATTRFNVNLRPRPTTDSIVLDTIPYQTTVPVIGRTEAGDWAHVRYSGQDGWVARYLVNLSGPLGEVPAEAQRDVPSSETAVERTTAPAEVSAVDTAFEPRELAVSPGTTVVWTNEGSLPHTVTADDGSFDSGTLEPGETFQFIFETAGEYPYYCEFHGGPGGEGMAGTIIVQE